MAVDGVVLGLEEARLLSPLGDTLGRERRRARRVRRESEQRRGSGRRRISTWRWMSWC